jgi:hypothetical protein
MTYTLPETAFYNLKAKTGFHGSVTVEQECYRPTHCKESLEEFFGKLIANPYARQQSYYVLTTRKDEESVKHSFAKYNNEYGSSFSAMCFFPELEEIAFALPVAAFDQLPESLWDSTATLPNNKYDKDGKVKESTLVIYKQGSSLETGSAECKPLFGKPVRHKTDSYINVTKLRQWLATKEGKAFHQEQLHATLEQECPQLLETIKRGVTIEELIAEAQA